MMVNASGFEDAVGRARAAPGLGIGLHLNLVQGRPIARAPSLVDPGSGELLPLRTLALRSLAGGVDARDVRAETAAQLARLRSAGIRVTHLDSHRHAHALPALWGPVVEAAREAGVAVVRRPRESLRLHALDLPATAKKLALGVALRGCRGAPVRSADHFVGLSLYGRDDLARRLLAILDDLPPGTTELMTHVGHSDAELAGKDPYTAERERELAALTSEPVRERLGRGDLELIHFGQL
jgi:predicted glycoside hydrolase/deacetylase ChbG (UPF0249 family)